MNNMENENTQHASRHLNQLFEAFMDADAANQATRDIETGDKLLNSFPAPSPSHEAIERIKADVSRALNRKRIVSIQWKVLSAVGAAAIIALGVLLSLQFAGPVVETGKPAVIAAALPNKIWEGSDITADDAELAVLSAEIETLKNTMTGVQVNYSDEYDDWDVSDLEMELIEISGDIWKG